MSKPCPGCGATTVPEARFCRLCGAPLKAGGLHENQSTVSPKAQTAPLKSEARSTEGLAADDPHRGAAETSKVGRVEIEEILRRVEADYRKGSEEKKEQDGAETIASQTAALNTEQAATTTAQTAGSSVSVAQPAQEVSQPQTSRGSRRLWTFAAIALL